MTLDTTTPARTALRRLPLGSITPLGWLADQLRLQADGLTGSLEDIWPDLGASSAWKGGDGEDWERGPYYLDGLVPLAHVLGDERLLARASTWIEAILAGQREDGFFGPTTNDDWWPRMVVLKVLTQWAEATDDERVVPFLQRYFAHQLRALPGRPLRDWGKWRGAENLLAVHWLYERTGEPWLLELAEVLQGQAVDWDEYFTVFPHREVTTEPRLSSHVVNVAMGVKGPAVRQLFDPSDDHRQAFEEGLSNLDRFHGQVHGMFSGDEHLAGTAAARGTELCAVVEMMFSLGESVRVWGDRDHADRLERVAYNLLPAGMNADLTAHQYHQQANQVLVDVARREWTAAGDDCTIFGLEPNFGCCTANLHQGWPKLLQSMWLATDDGGIAAVVHGPSAVRHATDSGSFCLTATTTYPFGDTIRYTVTEAPAGPVPLHLRVPAWCDAAEVRIAGEEHGAVVVDGFVVLRREWHAGDEVDLWLPAVPRVNQRPNGAVGIDLGPLVMAHCAGEIWERLPGSRHFGDWEVRPRSSWNLGLALGQGDGVVPSAGVRRCAPGARPFELRNGPPERRVEGAPVEVWLPGRQVDAWVLERNSAADPPASQETGPTSHLVQLVPYGSARIRVAEFPRVLVADGESWTSDDWKRGRSEPPA